MVFNYDYLDEKHFRSITFISDEGRTIVISTDGTLGFPIVICDGAELDLYYATVHSPSEQYPDGRRDDFDTVSKLILEQTGKIFDILFWGVPYITPQYYDQWYAVGDQLIMNIGGALSPSLQDLLMMRNYYDIKTDKLLEKVRNYINN